MSEEEQLVLSAAHKLGKGEARFLEYKRLATETKLTDGQVKVAAGRLQQQRLCMATFGGLQLTAAGIKAISES